MSLARALLALLLSVGCSTKALALDRTLLAYDTKAVDGVARQLLLNIARARHNQPIHFTMVSNIAATFRYTLSGGISPAATGDRGFLVVPYVGGSIEENPTISIAPMSGEEFTQRLLTPFEEQKLTMLLRQGYDVDALLRLLGAEIHEERNGVPFAIYQNRPSNRDGYAAFRRVVVHLSSIQDRHALHAEALHFLYTWSVPAKSVTPEAFGTTYAGYSLELDEKAGVYRVSKRIAGRVAITNYDPALLSNEERHRLHAKAEEAPYNDVVIDIRPGFPGGEYPFQGRLRLRSFHEVLMFVGRGIAEEREFDVPPDPRTPHVTENPISTLEVVEAKRAPKGSDMVVELDGKQYALGVQGGYQWNRKAFSMLYQLYQMSVTAAPNTGPAITIAK